VYAPALAEYLGKQLLQGTLTVFKRYLTIVATCLASSLVLAQCIPIPNTGTLLNPSPNAGRCQVEADGSFCYLAGKDQSIPTGKCETQGRPGNWNCTCNMAGQPAPYFVLNPGFLANDMHTPGIMSGGIGLLAVNGFSGNVTVSCLVSGPIPAEVHPSCTLTPTAVTVGSIGGFTNLSVPIANLPLGNYTVQLSASSDDGTTDLTSMPLVISPPKPKESGGGIAAFLIFVILIAAWLLERKWRMLASTR